MLFVDVMMCVTRWIIYLAPIGVCFLIAGQIVEMDDIGATFASLGWYFGTVMLGLLIHGLIVLPLIFGKITNRKIINNFITFVQPWLPEACLFGLWPIWATPWPPLLELPLPRPLCLSLSNVSRRRIMSIQK